MKSLFTLAALIMTLTGFSQFEDLVIVKVKNKGSVSGTTYQFYVQLQNEEDHIHIVFGDEYNTLKVETTAPFYQNEFGGGLSTNINPNLSKIAEEVMYDSFFTIGRMNSFDNTLANFNMDLSDFEEKGEGLVTNNGAWYITPDQPQGYCKDGNKFILIMQLTTEGVITGNLNMQGKNHLFETWREVDYKFSSENAISEKAFKKMKKSSLKQYNKDLKKNQKEKDETPPSQNNEAIESEE